MPLFINKITPPYTDGVEAKKLIIISFFGPKYVVTCKHNFFLCVLKMNYLVDIFWMSIMHVKGSKMKTFCPGIFKISSRGNHVRKANRIFDVLSKNLLVQKRN